MKKSVCILCFFILECHSKEILSNLDSGKEKPTIYITRDEVNALGDMKVADMFILMEHDLPISPKIKKYKSIYKKIKNTKEEIIIDKSNMLIVRLYGSDKNTQKQIQLMDVVYIFENNILINGPVIRRNNTVKIE
jgi:hypothetical protein